MELKRADTVDSEISSDFFSKIDYMIEMIG